MGKKIIKRIGIVLGIGCLVVVLVVGVWLSVPPRMLDFRGVVTDIEQADGRIVYHIEYIGNAETVVADAKTAIYCIEDKNDGISAQMVQVGDTIEGDYRWRAKDKEAKFIRVWE